MTTVSIEMERMSEYEDWSTLSDYLARQLVRGRMELVLGAGTSRHFGLPDWKALIRNLYSLHGAKPPKKPGTVQAEIFKNQYHTRNQDSFLLEVKKVLYDNVKIGFDQMMSHHVLSGILSMLLAAGPSVRTEVVTFNWDDLLERYLALHGRVVIPVFEEKHWSQAADITIFHPHGYLPYKNDLVRSERVIFDQHSYDEIMGSDTIWRQVLLALFRTRTCVLIGLSGEDPNLTALLVRARKEHASNATRTLYWAVVFTTDKGASQGWMDRGVYPVVLNNYRELPEKLFEISRAAVLKRAGGI
jgi:hypothetical protein